MPSIPFYTAGQIGIVHDIEPHELPPQAWSDGRNIRFRDGKVTRRLGQEARYGTPLGITYWLMLAYTPANIYWIYADSTKLYATDGATHADISRVGDYSPIDFKRLWNGGMFAGIPVITNGANVPQAWLSVSLSTDFEDLPNWTVGETCKVIRPFKNFLVAMNITRAGVTYENMIHWSHPADPGAVPTSWDSANPAVLAGERDLPDEFPGGIRDGRTLRDMLVIYKDNSVWGMQFIGGSQVFRTFSILGGTGILGANCVGEINEGKQHFFASSDDLIVFDGQNTQSVLDKRWKKYLANNIDINVNERSFVFTLERTTEAAFCYCEPGHVHPNMAILWNWKENTLSHRELGGDTPMITTGPVQIFGDIWDLDSATWDSDATMWDLSQFRASAYNILGVQPGVDAASSKILEFAVGQTFDGVDYTAYVERTDIALIGQARDGAPKADFTVRKIVGRVKPRIIGAPVLVSVGKQEVLGGGVTWSPTQLFTPGVTQFLDFDVNGLLIAIRFESSVPGEWELAGFDMNIEPLGEL